MTDSEAAQIIAYLSEAFRAEMTEAEILIWRGHLSPLDAAPAEAAAHACVRTLSFLPKIAEFTDAYRAEQRRALAKRPPGLPVQKTPAHAANPGRVQEMLAEARAKLGRPSERSGE